MKSPPAGHIESEFGLASELITLLIIAGVPSAFAVAGYLLRKVVDRWFDAGTKRFEIETRAVHDLELERLKVQLQSAAFEHETRFSRLHERRFRVLEQVYRRLSEAHRTFASMTSPIEFAGEPSKPEKQKVAYEAANNFIAYFHRNKILLPADLCLELERFERTLRAVSIDFEMREHGVQYWSKANKAMQDEVPPILNLIEAKARALIE